MQVDRPQVVGHYTNEIVYARLAPGLLRQLERFNPKMEDGDRDHRYYQHLTENVGYPELVKHLSGAIAIMHTVTPTTRKGHGLSTCAGFRDGGLKLTRTLF